MRPYFTASSFLFCCMRKQRRSGGTWSEQTHLPFRVINQQPKLGPRNKLSHLQLQVSTDLLSKRCPCNPELTLVYAFMRPMRTPVCVGADFRAVSSNARAFSTWCKSINICMHTINTDKPTTIVERGHQNVNNRYFNRGFGYMTADKKCLYLCVLHVHVHV
jgi:hypothetical protein